DGDGLLNFFRKRTLSNDSKQRLEELVKKLGDSSFPVREEAERELVAFGAAALPLVKAALDDPDLEIARRARRCEDVFENGPGSALPAAAARVLARKRPDKSIDVLIAFLPFADDESVDEQVLAALVTLAPATEKASDTLVKALMSKEATQRAAAGHV